MAWDPDVRTFMVCSVLLTAMTALLLLSVWRSLPKEMAASLRWWVAGLVIQPIGYSLLVLHGHASDLVSVVLANTLLAVPLGAFAVAVRRFHGVPDRLWRLVAVAALVALVSWWFDFVEPSRHWRVVVVCGLLAVLTGSSARGVLRRGGPRGANALATAMLFALGTGLLLFRAINELVAPLPSDSLLDTPTLQRWCFLLLSLLPVLSTVGFLLMCTERSQLALESAARHDHLTGIYNRRALEDLAHQAMASARRHGTPLAILIIDVDHFKRINDELGHHAGDLALVETVHRIRTSLRTEDLVGRLGGEEFVIVLPNTDGGSGLATAERVRAAFDERPIRGGEVALAVTVSIGVATLAPADTEFAHMLRRADRAMYAAKAAGRNCVMADSGALTSG